MLDKKQLKTSRIYSSRRNIRQGGSQERCCDGCSKTELSADNRREDKRYARGLHRISLTKTSKLLAQMRR